MYHDLVNNFKAITILVLILSVSCKSTPVESEPILRKHPSTSNIKLSHYKFFQDILPTLSKRKVVLVTNPSGIGNNPEKIISKFKEFNIELVSLIGLEHGFFGLEEDFSNSPVTHDGTFSLPIYHIYKLKDDEIEKVVNEGDTIILDVQDMGMRCYTYLTVLKKLMDSTKGKQIELIVLDHINPGMELGPRGDVLKKGYENLAGEFPLLLFTGLTLGESANYYNSEFLNNKVNLKVIPVENYNRKMKFERTGIPWSTPSPNLPTLETARNYFSLVLLEGINVSVGRGTQAPFIYFGAPWMTDPELISSSMDKIANGDYYFQTVYFKPSFSKYKDKICRGLRLTLVNIDYDPIKLSYNLIKIIKDNYKSNFIWAGGPNRFMVDLLWGNDSFRKAIDNGLSYEEFYSSFSGREKEYKEKIEKYYIYK